MPVKDVHTVLPEIEFVEPFGKAIPQSEFYNVYIPKEINFIF